MKKTKEIRNILLGHFVENENGKLQMIPKGKIVLQFKGAFPGWQATFFFGVGSSIEQYEVNREDRKKAWESLNRILEQIGDELVLTETENVQSYLCNYRLSIPAVLVAEEIEEGFVFTVFTGRSPTSWISRYRTLLKIKNMLPEFFTWKKVPKEKKIRHRDKKEGKVVKEKHKKKNKKKDKKEDKENM